MDNLISRLSVEGPRIWRQLTLPQRATLILVALAAVAASVYLTTSAQNPEFSPVFTKLSETDASAVVGKLKEMKIPYELADGGATIKVPSDQAAEVRLQMSSLGLPKGGSVGFELLDKNSFGLTDFAQKLNYQRALEGEIARTISRISGVEEARVHLVIPQEELFAQRQKPATASVVLILARGTELDSRQIRGVANLVSRSVEGLQPENVTIVDGDGLMLSIPEDGLAAGAGQGSTQRDAQRSYEQSLQRDLQAMLEQVLGPRKAIVRVSAALDWDQFESSSETYSPNGKEAQLRSAKEVVERSSFPLDAALGTIPTYPLDPRGPAGPANRPTPTPDLTTQTNGQVAAAATKADPTAEPKYERKETTNNYELSKLVERTTRAPGTVKRLSVSVMLDGQLDDGLVATISQSVTAAAGLDTRRGDQVVVAALPFDQTAVTAQAQAASEGAQRQQFFDIGRIVLAALSFLVVLFFLRSAVKGLTLGRSAQLATASLPRSPRVAAVVAPRAAEIAEADQRPVLAQREVAELAKAQPKVVADIIKSWLDEK